MNNIARTFYIILLVIILNESAITQNDITDSGLNKFSLYNTTTEFITSESLADSFLIFVSVPDNYFSSDKRYPVIYVLDGDIAFGMAVSISRYLQIGGNTPESIVVGIGYGAIGKSIAEKRKRDYGPEPAGSANQFLEFLKSQLIPYIDLKYRTTSDNRTINGFSLGGLFVLYTLFTQPDLFDNYIAGSPYLLWDDNSIYKFEENFSGKIVSKTLNVFISVGSEESDDKYFTPIDSLVTKIQEKNYPTLNLTTKVFDGSTHLAGPPESITHGLISVFRKEEY